MATKTARSFAVCCPECGDREATVRLDLNDLTACVCSSCDAEFTVREARDRAAAEHAKWDRILAWSEAAPTSE